MIENKKETIDFGARSVITVNNGNSPEAFPPHWHNAAEFTVALKNKCRFRVNDKNFDLDKGDILLVWPQQIHEIVSVPPSGVFFIQFPASIIENNLDLVSIMGFLYSQKHLSDKKAPELTSLITGKIYEMEKIEGSSDPLSETKCKLCIYEILTKIGEYVINEKKSEMEEGSRTGASWDYIHSACTYISENATENLTQSLVAEHLGLSTYYFSKLFNNYMHMSFPTYLSNVRVKKAAAYLLNADLSITECAFLSGFQSTTAFNKAFHDITGYSPREYRKMYR